MPAYDYKGIIGEKNTYTDGIIESINEDEAAFTCATNWVKKTKITIWQFLKTTKLTKRIPEMH